MQKYSKILSELDVAAHLVYNTHAKKVLDEFYSEEEEEQPTRKQKKQQQKQPRGRSETKEKHAKPKVDESKKKTLSNHKRLYWSLDWSVFCLFVKTFKRNLFNLLEC